jgi:hypothetical protein
MPGRRTAKDGCRGVSKAKQGEARRSKAKQGRRVAPAGCCLHHLAGSCGQAGCAGLQALLDEQLPSGWMVGQINGLMDRRTDEWMDGQTDGGMDGWMDPWATGWMKEWWMVGIQLNTRYASLHQDRLCTRSQQHSALPPLPTDQRVASSAGLHAPSINGTEHQQFAPLLLHSLCTRSQLLA